jgi:tetratricopeptide (TPR) repeat protein
MKRSFCIGVICFLYWGVLVNGQQLNTADSFFNAKEFNKAKGIYAGMLKSKPHDLALNYKYGVCLFKTGDYAQAVKALELASKKIPQASILLGDIAYQNYHFADAVTYYNAGLALMTASDTSYVSCLLRSEKAAKAESMLSAVQDVQIVDSTVVNKKEFFTYYNLSEDAGHIYSVVNADSGKFDVPLTGFITQRQDRKFFADTINGKSHIFTSNKLLNGWTDKQALSYNVNSPLNENFPFLLSDGITLYFASQGHGSMGGYDIFVTRFRSDTNDFLAPESVGMPFNSLSNDYLMAIDEEKQIGWFATDRYQLSGKVIIYKYKLNNNKIVAQSENLDQKIKQAQLKQYRLYSSHDSSQTSNTSVRRADKDTMSFALNDTVVYHSVEDFKSAEAKAAYLKGVSQEQKIKEIKDKLSRKRNEYAQAKTDVDRKKLMPEIVNLEQELSKLELNSNPYFKEARNLEIKKRKG